MIMAMQYVWTAKAEKDFVEKWGNSRPLARKAGTPATYDGKDLTSLVIPAYAERGWIKLANGKRKVKAEASFHGYRVAEDAQEKSRESRWKQLQFWLSQENVPSISYIAESMGLSSSEILTQFVRDHGERMAEKFGKLPFFPGGHGRKLSDAWVRVMEVRA
jgi:hypothetical protein